MKMTAFLLTLIMGTSAWANGTCKSNSLYIYSYYAFFYTSEVFVSKDEVAGDIRRSDQREGIIRKSPTRDADTWENRDTMLSWIAKARINRHMPQNLGANVASFLKETHETISAIEDTNITGSYSGKMRLDVLNSEDQIEAKEFTFLVEAGHNNQGYKKIKIEGDCTDDLYNNIQPLFKAANRSRPVFEPLKDVITNSIIFQILGQM